MARRGDAGRCPRAAGVLPGTRPRRQEPRHPPGRRLSGAGPTPPGTRRGVFVTVEGLDFSGKTTLVKGLKERWSGSRPSVFFTREPGGTPVAERVRDLVLDPELDMEPWTEAYLYAAARSDHSRREILPRLERGETVICERYLDSSVAYQGSGRELGTEQVRALNLWAVGGVIPDLTFYLRLSSEERERRARQRGAGLDRIERVGDEFMRRVERGFDELTSREPERIKVLDAALPPSRLLEVVVGEISGLHYTTDDG